MLKKATSESKKASIPHSVELSGGDVGRAACDDAGSELSPGTRPSNRPSATDTLDCSSTVLLKETRDGPGHCSYFQSGSSGCLRSHSGRRLRTVGISSKLYDGG